MLGFLSFAPALKLDTKREVQTRVQDAQFVEVVSQKPNLPVFRKKWWYSDDRLDARPVIWSLLNRRHEWEHKGAMWVHKPSAHVFHDSSWPASYTYLQSSNGCRCSTTTGWQAGQRNKLHNVMRTLENHINLGEQFAGHFVHE